MKNCQCGSDRIASVNAKCSDCCFVYMDKMDHHGYVPSDMGIGGGDYVEFRYCLNCGKMQDNFPLPLTKLEKC